MKDYGNTTPRNAAIRCIPIKVSGIYRITNTKDGKIYIGSAADIRKRLRHHLIALRGGNHSNRHLQGAFNRDGESVFAFDVLTLCEKAQLIEQEQMFMDVHKCYDAKIGYNLNPRADAAPVIIYTDEMRAAISVRFKGKPKSEEHRKKIGDAQRIRTCSPEMRERIKASLKAYWNTPGMREAHSAKKKGKTHKGTPHTAESKKKLSLAKLGRPAHNKGIPHTEEAKRKISVANMGRKASEETRRKMSLLRKGKPKKNTGPLTLEHRRKLSAALRGKPNLKNRKLSDERIAEWVNLRNTGKTFFEIARNSNVAQGTILKAIKRYLKEHPDVPYNIERSQGVA